MTAFTQFLPGTGRGTIRRMVEGAGPTQRRSAVAIAPSVSPSGCHLPTSGEASL